jgi:hypothetical protein
MYKIPSRKSFKALSSIEIKSSMPKIEPKIFQFIYFNLLKDTNFAVKNWITLIYMHVSKNVYKHSLFTSC